MDRKKRLKRIEGLKKQKEKHQEKIKEFSGKIPSYTLDYWSKEIARMDEEIREETRRLKDY
ncbi:MAG: hypothetical protein AABX66_01735 [Nanoarchaeota archaeon]